jgi:large subunit ribosomal protein L25
MLALKAQKRNAKEDLGILRKSGKIPAVFYGAGKKSTPISISTVEFKKIWHKAGESSTVKVSMTEGDVDTLIHEVQTHPVTDEPIHVDFLAIDMNKKIKIKVPIEFGGASLAVKNGLGTLVKVLYEIEIEALPKDLPHNLVADISKLATVESQVLVSDIKLPTGVVLVTSPQDVIASIALQVEEKEEVAVPVDLSAIEVEKKGKKEEEGTGEEAAMPAKEDKSDKK